MTSLMRLIEQHDLKIICITESHLTSSVSNAIVSIPHFQLFRKDVIGDVGKHGVCAYVHESLMVDEVADLTDNALSFRLASYNVHFACVYRPPSNDLAKNEALADCLQSIVEGKEIVVLGDLNLPGIQWSQSGCLPVGSYPPLETKFMDVFESKGLVQWVSEPTFPRSGNTLDLVLTSEWDRIGSVIVQPPLPACDHVPVVFDYIFSGESSVAKAVQEKFSWHKGNYRRLKEDLGLVDWNFELRYLNASDSFDRFRDIVVSKVLDHVPPKSRSSGGKSPWAKNPPRSLLSRRHEAWLTYKKVRLQSGRTSAAARDAFVHFSTINKRVCNFDVMSQASYEQSMIQRFSECPKLLHSYVRSKKVAPVAVGPLTFALVGGGVILAPPCGFSRITRKRKGAA